MGPPHRKSSLPKHQEVKKRFLEICDTTLSEEVRNALRLPAFDSYEWSDADIIHLMQTMFTELGFIEKFNIPIDILREWLYEVYKHYNEVPFHNFRHSLSNLLPLKCVIIIYSRTHADTSGASDDNDDNHDHDDDDHNDDNGDDVNDDDGDDGYNDISPLENHHCSIAFRLLEHPDCNIFKNFNRETFK
uniref:PDEase domain-containing protein n=1 Tax=Glossina palpalis gambiensis TaxID=67801 RepID=A0A1B0BDZ4_9MUSC